MTTNIPALTISTDHRFKEAFLEGVQDMLDDDLLKDFTIKVQGKSIRCHKLVLAAQCPYFRSMFRSGQQGPGTNSVELSALDYDVLNQVIRYLYTGSLSVSWDQMMMLVKVLHFLQLVAPMEKLKKHVLAHLHCHNCIGWYMCAEKYRLQDITESTLEIMRDEIKQVTTSAEFLGLDLGGVVDIIEHKELDVESVLRACFLWVTHVENRKDYLNNLVSHIEVKKCTLEGLTNILTEYNAVLENNKVVERILYKSLLSKSRSSIVIAQPSKSLLIVGGTVESAVLIDEQSASEIINIPPECYSEGQTACKVGNSFGLFGGKSANNAVLFDASSQSWTILPHMPQSLMWPAICYQNNVIYSFGGHMDKATPTNHHFQYKINNDAWTEVEDMPWEPIAPVAIACPPNHIYICSRSQQGLIMYNVKTKIWSAVQLYKDGLGCLQSAMTIFNNVLYIFGGKSNNSLQYDLVSREWSDLSKPPRQTDWGCLQEFKDKLWLIGGGSPEVQVYDISTDQWSLLDVKLPPKQQIMLSCALPWKHVF